MESPDRRTSRKPESKFVMRVSCHQCLMPVQDPGEPLSRFRCPLCSGVLIRSADGVQQAPGPDKPPAATA